VKNSKKKRRVIKQKPDLKEEAESPVDLGDMIDEVKQIAEPLCESEGLELVHVEYQSESCGRILRVYIDAPNGITLDDCSNISRQLSDILDISLQSDSSYRLEVSSPGTDRPLTKEEDFQKFKGEKAVIKTNKPINGQKNIKGILLGISEGTVKLTTNDKTFAVPFQEIIKARLINSI